MYLQQNAQIKALKFIIKELNVQMLEGLLLKSKETHTPHPFADYPSLPKNLKFVPSQNVFISFLALKCWARTLQHFSCCCQRHWLQELLNSTKSSGRYVPICVPLCERYIFLRIQILVFLPSFLEFLHFKTAFLELSSLFLHGTQFNKPC